jgi:hypothetical protein
MSTTADLVAARKVGGFTRVYPMGAVPPKTAANADSYYPYVVIGYAPNAPVVRNQLGQGDPVARFVVQHFGRTADAVEDQAAITFATFDGKAFAGNVVTQEIATPVDRDPDDRGVLFTTHTYRF